MCCRGSGTRTCCARAYTRPERGHAGGVATRGTGAPPTGVVTAAAGAGGQEIALAMRRLHAQTPRVMHRDLKPSNVLLESWMLTCVRGSRTSVMPGSCRTGRRSPARRVRDHNAQTCI